MSCGTKEGKPHIYTPIKAIRRKCIDCCCGSSKTVEKCPVTTCSLYPYRFGKSPARKGRKLSPEQKEKMAKQLAKARAKKGN